MHRLKFLERLHAVLEPSTYLEIGVRKGASLTLSHARSVGVDPRPEVEMPLPAGTELVASTSDAYFAHGEPPFGGDPIDLALIDGMHLFEFALRDFVNVERRAAWWSVVVFDDVLPRHPAQAARERAATSWTGDLFKLVSVLDRRRPDLTCLRVDVAPTGLLLVLGADPANRVLSDRYEELLAENVTPDPQHVPDDILGRAGAIAPEPLLNAPFWSVLRDGRARRLGRADGIAAFERSLAAWTPVPATTPGRLRRELRRRRDSLEGRRRRRRPRRTRRRRA